jgi:hypothetical protein
VSKLFPYLEPATLLFAQDGRKVVKIMDRIVVKYGPGVDLYEAEVMKYIELVLPPFPFLRYIPRLCMIRSSTSSWKRFVV